MDQIKYYATNKQFNPDEHLIVPAKTFKQLAIGDIFRAPSRTLTDAHASAFQTVNFFFS